MQNSAVPPKKSKAAAALDALMSKEGLNRESAARRIAEHKKRIKELRESQWMQDLTNPGQNQNTYYHWDGSKLHTFTKSQMDKAKTAGLTNKEAASVLRGKKKYTYIRDKDEDPEEKRHEMTYEFLDDVIRHHDIKENDPRKEAAKKVVRYKLMTQALEKEKKSGFTKDHLDAKLPDVYMYYDESKGKHSKIPKKLLDAAKQVVPSNENAAPVALQMAERLAKIKKRFQMTNDNDAMVRIARSRGNQQQPRYNYYRNVYVSSNGREVPGDKFAKAYSTSTGKQLTRNFNAHLAEEAVRRISAPSVSKKRNIVYSNKTLAFLNNVVKHHDIKGNDPRKEAAEKVEAYKLKTQTLRKDKTSGFTKDHLDAKLPDVYMYYDESKGKHVKIPKKLMDAAKQTGPNSNENAAPVALQIAERLPKIKKRFQMTNDNAIRAIARSRGNQQQPRYNYYRNVYVSSNGKEVPGDKIAKAYTKEKQQLTKNFNTELAERVAHPNGKIRDVVTATFKSLDDGKEKRYEIQKSLISEVQERHKINTKEEAIKKIMDHKLETDKLKHQMISGWSHNHLKPNFPRMYLQYDVAKRSYRKIYEEMMNLVKQDNPNMSEENARTRAAELQSKVAAIEERFKLPIKEAFKLVVDSEVGKHKKQAAADGGRGYYNFSKNKYVSSNQRVVGGKEFANAYKMSREESLPLNFNYGDAENAFALVSEATISKKAQELEAVRRKIDEEIVSQWKNSRDSGNVATLVEALLRRGGPLESRPLLTGNVGEPNNKNESPWDQVKKEKKTTNGCAARSKRWPDGQGASLEVHQAVVYTLCNLFAQKIIKQNGLLALHSVGAGKFFELLSGIVAFWNAKVPDGRPVGIFPVSVRSNFQGSNNFAELGRGAALLFPWFKSEVNDPKIGDYPFITQTKATEAIIRRLRLGHETFGGTSVDESHLLGSFATLAHDFYGQKGKRGYIHSKFIRDRGGRACHCVFLCDEMQMLFSPPTVESSYTTEYNQIKQLFVNRDETAFLLALTATPGDTKEVVNELMTAVAGKQVDVVRNPSAIKNLISFAYVSGDVSKFPRVEVVHHCVDIATDPTYSMKYLTRLSSFKEVEENMARAKIINAKILQSVTKTELRNESGSMYNPRKRFAYLKRIKQASEFLRLRKHSSSTDQKMEQELEGMFSDDKDDKEDVNNKTEGEGEATWEELKRRAVQDPQSNVIWGKAVTKANDSVDVCFLMSPKITAIINACIDPANKGVHFIYVNNVTTLRFIGFLLESRYGFEQYADSHGKSHGMRYGYINSVTSVKYKLYNFLEKKYTSPNKEVKETGNGTHTVSALLGGKRRSGAQITGALKHADNKDGSICKIVLATRDSYKGVDIPGIRFIHCVSALPDWTDLLQLIGRGTRNCGHARLARSQWRCKVNLWYLTHNEAETGPILCSKIFPDCYLTRRSLQSYRQGYGMLLQNLMDAAVDKELFMEYRKSFKDLQIALEAQCNKRTVDTARLRKNIFQGSTQFHTLKKELSDNERALLEQSNDKRKAVNQIIQEREAARQKRLEESRKKKENKKLANSKTPNAVAINRSKTPNAVAINTFAINRSKTPAVAINRRTPNAVAINSKTSNAVTIDTFAINRSKTPKAVNGL